MELLAIFTLSAVSVALLLIAIFGPIILLGVGIIHFKLQHYWILIPSVVCGLLVIFLVHKLYDYWFVLMFDILDSI